jgi:hypothetical protein
MPVSLACGRSRCLRLRIGGDRAHGDDRRGAYGSIVSCGRLAQPVKYGGHAVVHCLPSVHVVALLVCPAQHVELSWHRYCPVCR